MSTKEFGSLFQRASLMLNHCNRTGVKISAYWQGYVENAMLELQLVDGDIFSPKFYFASTFSGGSMGLSQLPDGTDRFINRLSQLVWKPFSSKIPWGIRKSAIFRSAFGPFFSLSVAMRKNVWRKMVAGELYDKIVRQAFDLSQERIAKYDLKPRNYRTPDDVDVFDPRSGENIHFSLDTLNRLKKIAYFQELADAQGKVVVEIGPGNGEMARLYVALGLVRRYILVDIPPGLAFSERHMIQEFGIDAVDVFNPDRASIDLSDGKLVSVLTPDQLSLIPSVDIGINEVSLGEMAPSIVEQYVSYLKQANLQDFISINHRLEKPNNKDKVGMNEYVRFFSPEMVLGTAKSVSFSSILAKFLDDEPNKPGYQLLHFKR
ncbi:MAG: putative sugar O-methyltransferase [Rhodospirillales bacterium]|nr:putative sugar O-methyltransferase [Rhodospirillales bacterium]